MDRCRRGGPAVQVELARVGEQGPGEHAERTDKMTFGPKILEGEGEERASPCWGAAGVTGAADGANCAGPHFRGPDVRSDSSEPPRVPSPVAAPPPPAGGSGPEEATPTTSPQRNPPHLLFLFCNFLFRSPNRHPLLQRSTLWCPKNSTCLVATRSTRANFHFSFRYTFLVVCIFPRCALVSNRFLSGPRLRSAQYCRPSKTD